MYRLVVRMNQAPDCDLPASATFEQCRDRVRNLGYGRRSRSGLPSEPAIHGGPSYPELHCNLADRDIRFDAESCQLDAHVCLVRCADRVDKPLGVPTVVRHRRYPSLSASPQQPWASPCWWALLAWPSWKGASRAHQTAQMLRALGTLLRHQTRLRSGA